MLFFEMRWYAWSGVVIIIAFFGVFFFSWYNLHSSLAIHVLETGDDPARHGMIFRQYNFTAEDGVQLAGWYIPVENAKAAIIVIHGYEKKKGGKSEEFTLRIAKHLHNAGYSLFLPDLRSYGESSGKKITLGVNEWKDAAASYGLVRQMPENQKLKIGFLGDSMGGAIAIITAGKTGKGDFVVASVPYANYHQLFSAQLAQDGIPGFALPFVLLAAQWEIGQYQEYAPDRLISKITAPLFIIGAEQDAVVGQGASELFKSVNKPKRYWQPPRSSHNAYFENEEEAIQRIILFLNEYAQE